MSIAECLDQPLYRVRNERDYSFFEMYYPNNPRAEFDGILMGQRAAELNANKPSHFLKFSF